MDKRVDYYGIYGCDQRHDHGGVALYRGHRRGRRIWVFFIVGRKKDLIITVLKILCRELRDQELAKLEAKEKI